MTTLFDNLPQDHLDTVQNSAQAGFYDFKAKDLNWEFKAKDVEEDNTGFEWW